MSGTDTSYLPDGNGGFTPCPDLLTEAEAIRWLRLDQIKVEHPEESIRRYRAAGVLRGVQISKAVLYPLVELRRFIAAQVEARPR
jgi:hypothetical protein